MRHDNFCDRHFEDDRARGKIRQFPTRITVTAHSTEHAVAGVMPYGPPPHATDLPDGASPRDKNISVYLN
jgi:hypothetical protein